MPFLVDTNILLRSAQPGHPLCSQATHAVSELLRQNESVFFCSQNIAEFWNVATRPPGANGLGMSGKEVLKEIGSIETLLTLLPDIPGIYTEWKRIVARHNVQGVKVYDARLVAVMIVYSIDSVLTFIRMISNATPTSKLFTLPHYLDALEFELHPWKVAASPEFAHGLLLGSRHNQFPRTWLVELYSVCQN